MRRFAFSALLALFALAAAHSTAGATPGASGTTDGSPGRTEFGHHHGNLQDARVFTAQGERTSTGSCVFDLPPLHLEPDENAIARYQLSIDRSDCTSQFVVGTPENTHSTSPDDGTHTSETSSTSTGTSGDVGTTSLSTSSVNHSSGLYRVWWEDIVNIDTTKVRSNITWKYDGDCVVDTVYGNHYWWWRSGTGWELDQAGPTNIDVSCSQANIYTSGQFSNDSFPPCRGGTVRTHYNEVTVTGTATGALYGHVDDTWTEEIGTPFTCPPLHHHEDLERTNRDYGPY
jgi:hypothetical protein